jgi:hypothetical protein
MIYPRNITDYNRTNCQLQEFILFAIVVAGKNSTIQALKLDEFLSLICVGPQRAGGGLPKDFFDAIKERPRATRHFLEVCRMGQYNRITKAFLSIAESNIDLNTCTIEELTSIDGIGLKTARFFVLHSRKDAVCAVLDTHILKFLANQDISDVPKSTPQNPKVYARLEKEFLNLVKLSGLTVAEYDLKLWKKFAK